MALNFFGGRGLPSPAVALLPHPPLSISILLIVEEAITRTWDLMRQNPRPGFDLSSADEDEVTHELAERLQDEVLAHRLISGFGKELFVISREPKLRSFDGKHLDPMPDILVRLVNRPVVAYLSQDQLFIECKPIDKTHHMGQHYCDKGLLRFVRGYYAWAMTNAMMVGYCADPNTVKVRLLRALQKRKARISTLVQPAPCPRSAGLLPPPPVHESKHERPIHYEGTNTQAPPISIRHLWLDRR